VYLFCGLVLMLLLVANVYDVPELNVGRYFYVHGHDDDLSAAESDGERQRLQSPSDGASSQRYTTGDPAAPAPEHDMGGGGGGGGRGAAKRSKKPDDKKRLTDDSM